MTFCRVFQCVFVPFFFLISIASCRSEEQTSEKRGPPTKSDNKIDEETSMEEEPKQVVEGDEEEEELEDEDEDEQEREYNFKCRFQNRLTVNNDRSSLAVERTNK